MKGKYLGVCIHFHDKGDENFICENWSDIDQYFMDQICDDDGCYWSPDSVIVDFVDFYKPKKGDKNG